VSDPATPNELKRPHLEVQYEDPIEGACRYIVKDRMDITGARWGLEGAEAILKLRAVIASGDFEDYWRFHLRREHERIHHAKYRDGLVLAA
jgi:hypothetical protein